MPALISDCCNGLEVQTKRQVAIEDAPPPLLQAPPPSRSDTTGDLKGQCSFFPSFSAFRDQNVNPGAVKNMQGKLESAGMCPGKGTGLYKDRRGPQNVLPRLTVTEIFYNN